MGSCFSSQEEKALKNCSIDSTPFHSLDGLTFKCVVLDCYDGDTCNVAIFIDKRLQQFKCRLSGIDTPEMKIENQHAQAVNARNFLIECITNKKLSNKNASKKEVQQHLHNNKTIIKIECGKWDKYGRLLATFYTTKRSFSFSSEKFCINHEMIKSGYAKPYNGGKKE